VRTIGWIAAFAVAAACSPDSDVSRTLGARCDTKADCQETCAPDPEYPGGFCTLTCLRASDCPSGATCVAEEGGVCLFECDLDSECDFLGPGWICADVGAVPDGEVRACRGD